MNVEVSLQNAIKNKLEKLNKPETKIQIHQVLKEMCDPYVPYNTGQLANSAKVDFDGVHYSATDNGRQYASEAYEGVDMNFRKDQHPLASAHWDKAMLRDHRGEFNTKVKEIIVEAMNE